MSNLYVNIRVGLYHLQVTNDWKFSFERNNAHVGYPDGRFKVYQFFRWI